MKKQLPTSQFFDTILDAPFVNDMWSWGAINRDGDKVIFRVWGHDMIKLEDGTRAYRVLRGQAIRKSHGRPERIRHLDLIRSGLIRGEMLVCTAKNPLEKDEEVLKIKSYGNEVFGIDQLVDVNGDTYATIKGYRNV